ncbi:MAG: helix-turn-helix domain-containing protein [bacterium]
MNKAATLRSLEDLGFTRVEAEVYVYLLGYSPATGYQIAKAISRTRGAAYGVLASLAAKGAVVVDVGETQLWRAVPAAEFLDLLEQRFLRGKREAAGQLKTIEPAPPDSLVYQLKTPEQVYQRARRMLGSCEKAALLDLDHAPLKVIRPDIEAAVKRGVKVALISPEIAKLAGARVSAYYAGYEIPSRARVHQFVLSTDGREFLISSLSTDGERVVQACWSASPFLSWVVFTYLKMSILGEEFVTRIEAGASGTELKAAYKSYFKHLPPYESPGFERLRKMFETKR